MGSRAKRKRTAATTATAHSSSRPHAERLASGIVCIVLAIIVWLAFGQVIHHEFVNYDDGDYVYENPQITAGLTLSGIGWAFTHVHAANWHPLTTISHMLDCQLYGIEPSGHHLTNVLLHAAAAVLLFLALRKLTLSIWPSAFVAALFAVHPLRVESVAWVSERKDVLSGVFFMLTLLAYAYYAQSERRSLVKYATVVILFALGLLCKPSLVTLPFVLLLLDYWPLGRMQSAKGEGQRMKRFVIRGLVVEKAPLFVLSAASCVITVIAQKKALDTDLKLNLVQRAGNAALSCMIYVGQMVWPTHLTVMYPYNGLKVGAVAPALLFLITVSIIFILCRNKYPFLLVGWLWYLGMLIPMIGLVQVGLQSHADRYTYLPQIGLYVLITWGVATLFSHSRRKRAVLGALALLALTVLTLTSRAQTVNWRSSETLWEHAIENTSNNYVAYDNLGTVLLRKRQPEAAVRQFQKALQIKPDFEDACVSAGSALMLMGQTDQAIDFYQKALQIRPDSAEDWSNLATARLRKGKIEQAIENYEKAASIKPESAEMQYNLGHAFAINANWADAIAHYQTAIRIQPGDAKFYNNLGIALAEIGKMDEALEQIGQALRINPKYAEAHYNLGTLLAHAGRTEEGKTELREALRLKPDYQEAEKRLRELSESSPR